MALGIRDDVLTIAAGALRASADVGGYDGNRLFADFLVVSRTASFLVC